MKKAALTVLVIFLLIPLIALLFYKTPNATPVTSITPSPSASSLQDPADVATAHQVLLHTSKGDISLHLYPEDAPNTVKNFVTLGKRGYYNNVIFHRVIQNFVIQAGDPSGNGTGGQSIYGNTFPGEIKPNHKFVKGTLGMARTNTPDTYGSQFFIVSGDAQPSLDGNYTIFGQADDASLVVVQAIASTPVDANDKPTTPVTITGFEITKP